jgi:hypothetical protein
VEIVDVFQNGCEQRFNDSLSLFASGESWVSPRPSWRVGTPSLWIAAQGAELVWIEVADGFFHLHRLWRDIKHHRGFDFVRMRTTGLTNPFFSWILFREIGVAKEDTDFVEFSGGLGERLERGNSSVQDVEAPWPWCARERTMSAIMARAVSRLSDVEPGYSRKDG